MLVLIWNPMNGSYRVIDDKNIMNNNPRETDGDNAPETIELWLSIFIKQDYEI